MLGAENNALKDLLNYILEVLSLKTVSKRKLLLTDCCTTGSGHFFAICMFIFHKSEVQMVILMFLIGLNLNQQKMAKKWSEMIVKQWVMSNFRFETLFIYFYFIFLHWDRFLSNNHQDMRPVRVLWILIVCYYCIKI